jgi:catechol 2,3-dioxygenase-like lactoylglutathione lyase family enzyme
MTYELDHIHIRCQDLEASIKYYQELFGARETGRGEAKGMPIVRLSLGGAPIALSPRREGMEVEFLSGRPRYGVWQIGFKVADLAAAMAELTAKGAKFTAGPVVLGPHLSVAFVQAPDGVEVEIMEHRG